MAEIPEELRAKNGRAIPPTWEKLQKWVGGYPVRPGGSFRYREFPGFTQFRAVPEVAVFNHPFKLSVSGITATLLPGTVNGEAPRMGKERLTLDGFNKDGEETDRRPELILTDKTAGGEVGSGTDGRSFICVQMKVDQQSREPAMDAEDFLLVVNLKELPEGFEAGGMPERLDGDFTIGVWPLGICYWNKERSSVRKFRQYAFWNLNHRYIPAKAGTTARGRHWFGP